MRRAKPEKREILPESYCPASSDHDPSHTSAAEKHGDQVMYDTLDHWRTQREKTRWDL
jgi:hypothetical protein